MVVDFVYCDEGNLGFFLSAFAVWCWPFLWSGDFVRSGEALRPSIFNIVCDHSQSPQLLFFFLSIDLPHAVTPEE